MKAVVADFQYKVHCLRIVPLWGNPVYLTDYPRDLTMNGHTYKTDSGYEFSGNSAEANMSPGSLDLNGIAGIAGIGYDQVAAGVFDNARVYAFATTWRTPIEDEEPLGVALCGKTIIKDNRYTINMMMVMDVFNQSVGETYMPPCQKKFGGQEFGGCKLALAPITVTGTITSITSATVMRDSARTQAVDYFGEGTIKFTSGTNAGLKPMEIKTYAANGTIEIYESFYYPVVVGDAYSMIPGCRKRQVEDCATKWNNITNFGGFSFVPTTSTYTTVGNH